MPREITVEGFAPKLLFPDGTSDHEIAETLRTNPPPWMKAQRGLADYEAFQQQVDAGAAGEAQETKVPDIDVAALREQPAFKYSVRNAFRSAARDAKLAGQTELAQAIENAAPPPQKPYAEQVGAFGPFAPVHDYATPPGGWGEYWRTPIPVLSDVLGLAGASAMDRMWQGEWSMVAKAVSPKFAGKLNEVQKGFREFGQEFASGLATPEMLALGPAGVTTGPVGSRLVGLYFLSQMAAGAPHSMVEAWEAYKQGDIKGATKGLLNTAAAAIFGYLIGKHAVGLPDDLRLAAAHEAELRAKAEPKPQAKVEPESPAPTEAEDIGIEPFPAAEELGWKQPTAEVQPAAQATEPSPAPVAPSLTPLTDALIQKPIPAKLQPESIKEPVPADVSPETRLIQGEFQAPEAQVDLQEGKIKTGTVPGVPPPPVEDYFAPDVEQAPVRAAPVVPVERVVSERLAAISPLTAAEVADIARPKAQPSPVAEAKPPLSEPIPPEAQNVPRGTLEAPATTAPPEPAISARLEDARQKVRQAWQDLGPEPGETGERGAGLRLPTAEEWEKQGRFVLALMNLAKEHITNGKSFDDFAKDALPPGLTTQHDSEALRLAWRLAQGETTQGKTAQGPPEQPLQPTGFEDIPRPPKGERAVTTALWPLGETDQTYQTWREKHLLPWADKTVSAAANLPELWANVKRATMRKEGETGWLAPHEAEILYARIYREAGERLVPLLGARETQIRLSALGKSRGLADLSLMENPQVVELLKVAQESLEFTRLEASGAGQALRSAQSAIKEITAGTVLADYFKGFFDAAKKRTEHLPKDIPAQFVDWLRDAGEHARNLLGNILEQHPILDALLAIKGRVRVTPVDPAELSRVIDAEHRAADYRKFYSEKGAQGLARSFWELMSGEGGPEGHIWVADKALRQELGRILRQKMADLKLIDVDKASQLSDAEKVAQVLGKAELRAGKLKAIDAAMRDEFARRRAEGQERAAANEDPEKARKAAEASKARYDMLEDAWHEVMSSMANVPASNVMLKRLIHAKLKEAKVNWVDVFKRGGKAIAELGDRITAVVAKEVSAASSGLDTRELGAYVRAVFDEIAAIRQNRFEMGVIGARARAAFRLGARPETQAAAIIRRVTGQFSNMPKPQQNEVLRIFQDQVKNDFTPESFRRLMEAAGVPATWIEKLYRAAAMQRAVLAELEYHQGEANRIRQRNELLTSGKGLDALLAKTARLEGVNWADLLQSDARTQRAWREQLAERIRTHPLLHGLSRDEQIDLARLVDAAFQEQRNRALKRTFGARLLDAKIKPADVRKLSRKLPELIRLANAGALDDYRFRLALADEYGMRPITTEGAQRIYEKAQRAQKMAPGVNRWTAFRETYEDMARESGISIKELMHSWWYQSVLCGAPTQVVNAMGSASVFWMQATAMVARDPIHAPQIIMAALRGMREGAMGDFLAVVQGQPGISDVPRLFEGGVQTGLKGMRINPYEAWRRSTKKWQRLLGNTTYVMRLMAAVDSFWKSANAEMSAEFYAWEEAKKLGMKGETGRTFVAELLKNRPEDIARADKVARAEAARGELTSTSEAVIRRRRNERLNEERPPAIREQSGNFAVFSTLNSIPTGLLGEAYKLAMKFGSRFGLERTAVMPFVRVSSNVINLMLEQTPVALAKLLSTMQTTKTGKMNWVAKRFIDEPMDLEAYHQMRARIAIGAFSTLAVYLASQLRDENGKRRINIMGSMRNIPPNIRAALIAAGAKPYSIEVPVLGYVDMRFTPAMTLCATIGEVNNGYDYGHYGEKEWDTGLLAALWGPVFAVIDQQWLSGLAAVLDPGRGGNMDPTDAWTSFVKWSARFSGGMIPNLAKQIDKALDPTVYKPEHWYQWFLAEIPGIRRWAGYPALDNYARPVTRAPWNQFGRARSDDPVDIMLEKKARQGVALTWRAHPTLAGADGQEKLLTGKEEYAYRVVYGKILYDLLRDNLDTLQTANPMATKRTFELYQGAARLNAENAVKKQRQGSQP